MRPTRLSILPILLVFLLAGIALAQEKKFDVTIENNVSMKTRDGVTLQADVYRPKAEAKFPVILERTPYDKHMGVGFGLKAAARGYVYVIQDVRGRYTSLNRAMATTRWNGLRRFLIPAARLAW